MERSPKFRLNVTLDRSVRDRLIELAELDHREPSQQAAIYIERAVRRAGGRHQIEREAGHAVAR